MDIGILSLSNLWTESNLIALHKQYVIRILEFNDCESRVSTENNFVGILTGIPIEIIFAFWRNYWSKWSKLIEILISIVGIEIP
jgi:hypothetical protein